jgi:hypothetical protein
VTESKPTKKKFHRKYTKNTMIHFAHAYCISKFIKRHKTTAEVVWKGNFSFLTMYIYLFSVWRLLVFRLFFLIHSRAYCSNDLENNFCRVASIRILFFFLIFCFTFVDFIFRAYFNDFGTTL